MALKHHAHRSHRRSRKDSAHDALLFGLARHKRAAWGIGTGVVALVAAFALVLYYTDLSWESVTDLIHRVDPIAALPLMAVLPVLGFPISIVYLFAGARFGPLGGGAIVGAITAVHLVLTHLIANSFLRGPLQRFIEKRHKHLPQVPEDEQAAVCVIATLVPGLPYFVRNYLLALAGVKLKYFFLVCLPIYVARSYVTILLGDMGADPDKRKIFILLGLDALKVAICACVIWRLRAHHRQFHGHEHDQHGDDLHHHHGPDAAAAAK